MKGLLPELSQQEEAFFCFIVRRLSNVKIFNVDAKSGKKRQGNLALPFCNKTYHAFCYFLIFLLIPANPISPRPRRSMVAGSGTAARFKDDSQECHDGQPASELVEIL